MTVGIVVRSNCVVSGHRSGVTTLFTSGNGEIVLGISPDANIAKLFELRDDL